MTYKGKIVRVENRGIQGLVIAEDITCIKIQSGDGLVYVVDKVSNVITIISLAIKLVDLLGFLWKKIKSSF